jgi:hypothetical protein
MQTKTKLLLVTGLLVVATVSAIGFYATRPQSIVAASVGIEQSLPNHDQNASQQIANSGSSQTVNDITVEVTSTRSISTGIEVGICFTTLDGGDWYPVPGHLFYGTNEVYPDEFEFTSENKANASDLGERCALVRYVVKDAQNVTGPIQFSVINFVAHPREMPPCQDFQERLDTNAKANDYMLKAECVENSEGTISVTLASFDESVTLDEATKLLNEIANGEVPGPWEFTLDELEK